MRRQADLRPRFGLGRWGGGLCRKRRYLDGLLAGRTLNVLACPLLGALNLLRARRTIKLKFAHADGSLNAALAASVKWGEEKRSRQQTPRRWGWGTPLKETICHLDQSQKSNSGSIL